MTVLSFIKFDKPKKYHAEHFGQFLIKQEKINFWFIDNGRAIAFDGNPNENYHNNPQWQKVLHKNQGHYCYALNQLNFIKSFLIKSQHLLNPLVLTNYQVNTMNNITVDYDSDTSLYILQEKNPNEAMLQALNDKELGNELLCLFFRQKYEPHKLITIFSNGNIAVHHNIPFGILEMTVHCF